MHDLSPVRGRPRTLLATAILSVLAVAPAHGQAARSGGGGDQRVVQQMQQLAQERTALQAENTRLKQELEKATGELKSAQGERDALKKRAATTSQVPAKAACAESEAALQQKQARLDELVPRFRETAQTLKETEIDRGRLNQELAQKTKAFDSCALANQGLYEVADEALTRYEQYSIARKEPFSGVSRHRIENLVDGTRDRARELKVTSSEKAQAAPASAVP